MHNKRSVESWILYFILPLILPNCPLFLSLGTTLKSGAKMSLSFGILFYWNVVSPLLCGISFLKVNLAWGWQLIAVKTKNATQYKHFRLNEQILLKIKNVESSTILKMKYFGFVPFQNAQCTIPLYIPRVESIVL